MSVSPAARGVAAGEGHVFGAVGCIDLSLGRFAAGFLFVSAAETLANATICRFCGCDSRRWIVCQVVRIEAQHRRHQRRRAVLQHQQSGS